MISASPSLPKIEPIAGAKFYPVFENTGADALSAGEVSLLQPDQGGRHSRRGVSVESVEPFRKGAAAVEVNKFPERLIPLLPGRLDIDLRNTTFPAGRLRKSLRSPCLIRAFQQWEGTQHHALPEPRG